MAPTVSTPPTPSPSAAYPAPDSLYDTPSRPPSPLRAQVSPPHSETSASTIRTSFARHDDLALGEQIIEPALSSEPSPTSHFLDLHTKAQAHSRAFRVHSPGTSPDTSLIWSGNPATSGFYPYNAHLACSPAVYLKTMARVVELAGWDNGSYVRHTMVDHINGKMRQSLLNIPSHVEERPGTPEDEKSPWISGTWSLMWAIWEVARRLAWDESLVGFAVIKREELTEEAVASEWLDIDEDEEKVMTELQKWRKGDERRRRGYIAKEVLVSPLRPISNAIGTARAGDMSVSMKEAYEMALRSARESEEVLWYGRIFAESVEQAVEFSADNLPFELPPQFYKPRGSNSSRARLVSPIKTATDPAAKMARQGETNSLQGWLSNLIWDPRCDQYERAVQKVVERRRQLFVSRGVVGEACPLTPM